MIVACGPRAAFVSVTQNCAQRDGTGASHCLHALGSAHARERCNDESGPVGPAAEEPAAPAPTPGPPTVSMALPRTKHCVKKLSAGLDSVRSLIFGSHLGQGEGTGQPGGHHVRPYTGSRSGGSDFEVAQKR